MCGSPQYMDNAIKSVLYYRLMTSTAALSYVFLRFPSLQFFCDGNEIRTESLQPRRK